MEQIWTKSFTRKTKSIFRFLIDSSFQGVNRLFVLSFFENEGDRKVHTGYYLSKVEKKDYSIVVDERNFFDQPIVIWISDMITYDNIGKIATGQGDHYTTGCVVDYNYLRKHKMIVLALSKQQALDVNPKAIQQTNFTWNHHQVMVQ